MLDTLVPDTESLNKGVRTLGPHQSSAYFFSNELT